MYSAAAKVQLLQSIFCLVFSCLQRLTEWFSLPKYGGGEYKYAVLPSDPHPPSPIPSASDMFSLDYWVSAHVFQFLGSVQIYEEVT